MRALIFGVAGQDGLLMSHFLSEKDYEITGVLLPEELVPETASRFPKNVRLVEGSIGDRELVRRILREETPDHIYNFAGISFVPSSWMTVSHVAEINGFAVSQLCEIAMQECPGVRFFQAGSSEMFGHNPLHAPQNESTPFNPDNPYASAKVFATHITRNFRSHFGMHACVGISYNHESPLRGPQFVTRKITMAAAAIKMGLIDNFELGNIHALRDWSYAGDIVEAMWLMLTADEPKDYVLCSGKLHSVKDWLDIAFSHLGLSWENHLVVNPELCRPSEAAPLHGDPSLAMKELDWKPRLKFEALVRMMADSDLEKLKRAG